MAKDCCWNCKYYIAKGDNEPALLRSAGSNVCVFSENNKDIKELVETGNPTPPDYKCIHYEERYY